MADDSNIIGQVASGNAPQPAADAASTVDYSKVADETVKAMDANTDGTEDLDLGDEDSIDEAQATGEISKKEAQSLKKKLKLKVDGREFEEEVDLGDEAYLTRELQKSKAFDKRMQEFAEYKKKVDAFMNAFNEDPEGLLEKMGKNVDELAEKRLRRRVEEMEKSPEQLEREKMAKELEELRLEKKRIQEEKERQEIEALRNQHAMELERDIKQALENADTVLPKRSPLVMHRIGQALFLAMKSGYPNVKVKDVIPLVEKQYKQELSELFKVMPEDTIEALIGKEPLHKWRKSLIAKNKAAKVQADVPSKGKIEDTGNKQRNEPTAEPKRFKDFFKYND
jgi:hypothetical protein